ncbi:MAG: DNA topoisomerase I [Candidatus ainarchaeum sp.]|nr:DNA topoisomerase I [Candidatus ainarchaeum sp.]MDD3975870.1 DNA topoisomerase I [Candidatus ainarchaeum sp.]
MKLIISEKAIAGKKIVQILSKNNFETLNENGINCFFFKEKNEKILLVPLRGHINTVDFIDGDKFWSLYTLDLLADKKFLYKEVEKKIINILKKERKELTEIIIATDADREGEAIGLEAYNYIKLKNPNANLKRAYFSALTEKEVNDAFSNLRKLDFNYANSVFARQEIDLLWGAILTRYLSIVANRKGKMFLSAGRVQTPLLNLIVERELDRQKFKKEKYKVINAIFEKRKNLFEGLYKENKIFDLEKANLIFENIKKEKQGIVTKISKNNKIIKRPEPFNTTSFLRAASAIGISTNKAMSIAENLYQNGFISYPRTDNTVYPESLNLKEILGKLKLFKEYYKFVEEILKKPLNPSKGNKKTTDHPPIHPVEFAPDLSGPERKIYDLIARRFMATLSIDAKTENISAIIEIKKEPFIVNGQTILEPGWKTIYTFSKLNEIILPNLEKGEQINIEKINIDEKETMPPSRYTEGGLIKLMEDQNLGTKSTRPAIIQKLRDRNYIEGKKTVDPTEIAISVCSVLNKHANIITKPKLTADTEEEMEKIATGKKEKEEVVNENRNILHKVVKVLLDEKENISKELKGGINQTNYIGKCPKCGKDLIIRYGKTGKQFVACTGFPSCRNTYPLPQKKNIKATGKICEICNEPIVLIIGKRNSDIEMCLNPKCKSKEEYLKKRKEKMETEKNESKK